MNRTERRRTAYHEAGHAVINAVVGIRFRRVTIVPQVHLLGWVEQRRLPDIIWRNPVQIRRLILSCLSGGIAEKFARRDGQASGLAEDLDKAIMLVGQLPGCRTRQSRVRRFEEMHAGADVLVRRHWDAIGEVAERLVRDKTLSECQVLGICKETKWAALIEVISTKDGADFLLRRGVDPEFVARVQNILTEMRSRNVSSNTVYS